MCDLVIAAIIGTTFFRELAAVMMSPAAADQWGTSLDTRAIWTALPTYPTATSDNMVPSHGRKRSYYIAGMSAVEATHAALIALGGLCESGRACRPEPRRVLLLPSGAGREARAFRAAYPHARLLACDLNEEYTAFVARTFNATAVPGSTQPAAAAAAVRRQSGGALDAIWMGSFFTHLGQHGVHTWLHAMRGLLSDRGVLMATAALEDGLAHFRTLSQNRRREGARMRAVVERLETSFVHSGRRFGFAAYNGTAARSANVAVRELTSWGLSVMSVEWMLRAADKAGLRLVYFANRGFGAHQAIFGLALAEPWPRFVW